MSAPSALSHCECAAIDRACGLAAAGPSPGAAAHDRRGADGRSDMDQTLQLPQPPPGPEQRAAPGRV
eukprot:scaffold1439_cov404-Prasinococcus_capsulatus_cf.AAC.30